MKECLLAMCLFVKLNLLFSELILLKFNFFIFEFSKNFFWRIFIVCNFFLYIKTTRAEYRYLSIRNAFWYCSFLVLLYCIWEFVGIISSKHLDLRMYRRLSDETHKKSTIVKRTMVSSCSSLIDVVVFPLVTLSRLM